jgi:plasmid stability protein
MKITVNVPDSLAPALRAAATAHGDADAAAFVTRAIRDALAGEAQKQVELAKQADYRTALQVAQDQLAADLKAISAT